MGEAVVGFLVERLCDLLNEQEAEVVHGVRYQVEEIIAELRILQGLLRNAGAKRDEERIRNWASDAREVVYDATDILESLILKVITDKKGIKNSGIKGDFKTIKSRISKLITRSRIYGIRSLTEDDSNRIAYNRQHPLNRTYSHVVADQEVIGLEGDIEYLVGHLTNYRRRENCYRVISICGMGGLGKTTLAGKIYNHPIVIRHFDCLSWVCISRQWQTNDILGRILLKLSPERRNEDLSLRDDAELVRMIFDILRGKRYLIVLDDIWSNDAWDCIKAAFPVENMSSKILLTTRNVEVARHVERESLVHQPKFLNEEQSWELLLKKTCIKRNRTDPRDAIEMEKLGREMIRHRCRGLPLAILVLGGILATKPTLSQWEIVHENIGTGEGFGKDHQAEVERMLISSYYDLPDELKPCFLYLCKFPEDSEIEAERLYQLWMAEGMVLSKDRREGETMMEVAESYMGELSHRCMVQVEFEEDESSVRKFKSCYLHDLMRDLSLKKAKEEDFFKVLDIQNGNDHEVGESSSSSNYTRRLVISPGYEANSDNIQIIHDKEVGQHLRSLLLTNFVQWEWKPPIPVVAGFHPSNLKYVRILALEGIRLEFKLERSRIKNFFGINCCSSDHQKNNTIIEEEDDNGKVHFRIPSREEKVLLSNLIHLRYLSFRWSSINVVPSYTGNLEHLQTLDLRVHGKRRHHSASFLSVSGMLRTMGRRLHHLYLPRDLVYHTFLPLNGLSNLETLENFNPAYCGVKDLIKLTNLRKLTMCVNGYTEGLEDFLNYLLSSQVSNSLCCSSLVIRNGGYFANSEIGQKFLRQIWGCCNLHQLEIHGAIKKLPPVVTDNHDNVNFLSRSLTTLLLFSSSLEEDPMATLERIPNLRSLVLSYNAFLGKEMVCSVVGFPHLKSLQLCYLRNLEEWVVDDGAMPNLSTIQIECCNKLKMLPDGFRFLTSLRVLDIVDMPEDFRYRVQSHSVVDGGIGEDFYKVRHVPCINLRP